MHKWAYLAVCANSSMQNFGDVMQRNIFKLGVKWTGEGRKFNEKPAIIYLGNGKR